MVYCQKCGRRNDEDAKFCNKCGSSLIEPRRYPHKPDEDKCEDECSSKRHPSAWTNFWIIILALVAIGIVISLIIRIFGDDLPSWFRNFEYWDIFGLLIGLIIISFIIYMITQSKDRH